MKDGILESTCVYCSHPLIMKNGTLRHLEERYSSQRCAIGDCKCDAPSMESNVSLFHRPIKLDKKKYLRCFMCNRVQERRFVCVLGGPFKGRYKFRRFCTMRCVKRYVNLSIHQKIKVGKRS